MATAVASRFAVLSIDDDDDSPKRNQKKKAENKRTGTGMSTQKTDSSQKKKSKKCDSCKVGGFKIHKRASKHTLRLAFDILTAVIMKSTILWPYLLPVSVGFLVVKWSSETPDFH
jgi:hypothetical protein